MNYNNKLDSLTKELEATMKHAEEVKQEIVATIIERDIMEAIDQLDNEEKAMLLLLTLIQETEQEKPQPKVEENFEEDCMKLFELLYKMNQ